jgi:hypothetical protein
MAITDFLQRQKKEQMLLRLKEVYASGAEPSDKGTLSGMKARFRRTVKDAGERDSARTGLLARLWPSSLFRTCGTARESV